MGWGGQLPHLSVERLAGGAQGGKGAWIGSRKDGRACSSGGREAAVKWLELLLTVLAHRQKQLG